MELRAEAIPGSALLKLQPAPKEEPRLFFQYGALDKPVESGGGKSRTVKEVRSKLTPSDAGLFVRASSKRSQGIV